MRISDRGAKCDICGKVMHPFEYITMKGHKSKPGKDYVKVSSDIASKVVSKNHLCEDCFNELLVWIDTQAVQRSKERNVNKRAK